MKLSKAVNTLKKLNNDFKNGKIKEKDYYNKVKNIVAESSDGVTWKVDDKGQWHKSVDNEWIHGDVNKHLPKGPENLFQLLITVIKGFFTNIPKLMKKFLIIGGITLIAHTYFVIFPNGGFTPGSNPFLNNILALKNNVVAGTAFWTILSYIITSTFYKIYSLGPAKFLSGLLKGPFRALKALNKKYLPLFSFITILLLLLNKYFIENSVIATTVAIGAFFAIIVHRYSLTYLVFKVGFSDFHKLIKKPDKILMTDYTILFSCQLFQVCFYTPIYLISP